jgi:hypothetical protein
VDLEPFALAIEAEVALPIGTAGALVGEARLRGGPGLAVEGDFESFAVLVDGSLFLRHEVDTGHGLVVGPELIMTAGVRVGERDASLQLLGELHARKSLPPIASVGADPITLDLGVRLRPESEPRITVSFGLGTALD